LQRSGQIDVAQDPFDKERIAALKTIQTDGKKWIAAHAKGGSAPSQAAKRMYVAVDAVVGHVTANGAAPLPKSKINFVNETLGQVCAAALLVLRDRGHVLLCGDASRCTGFCKR
jgi:Photosystem II Pbs27